MYKEFYTAGFGDDSTAVGSPGVGVAGVAAGVGAGEPDDAAFCISVSETLKFSCGTATDSAGFHELTGGILAVCFTGSVA